MTGGWIPVILVPDEVLQWYPPIACPSQLKRKRHARATRTLRATPGIILGGDIFRRGGTTTCSSFRTIYMLFRAPTCREPSMGDKSILTNLTSMHSGKAIGTLLVTTPTIF